MQPLTELARTCFTKRKAEIKGKGHKGLLFERFYDGYDHDFKVDPQADSQQLNELVGPSGDDEDIKEAARRRIQMVSALGGEFAVFATDWHFVTGMGNSHPAENGFSWHPVLGAPYLPGAGVKGLLRAWMETCVYDEGEGHEKRERLDEWFGRNAGSNGKADSGKAGDLVFFDAIPVERPIVEVDIMTPHMGKWYEQGGESFAEDSIPGDWHNPVPVSFLVTSDARFLFSIAPRTPTAAHWVKDAFEHLSQALAWLGAGAKTASGYGHMTLDKEDTLKRQKSAQAKLEQAIEESRLAIMTPGQRALAAIEHYLARDQVANRCEPGGNCKRMLREAVEGADVWSLDERQALADLAVRVLSHHDGQKWKKKDKPKALYRKIRELID